MFSQKRGFALQTGAVTDYVFLNLFLTSLCAKNDIPTQISDSVADHGNGFSFFAFLQKC